MANFEPPSFSLGLDFDLDSEPQGTVREDPKSEQAPRCSTTASLRTIVEDDDDDDDCDIVSEPRDNVREDLASEQASRPRWSATASRRKIIEDDDDFESPKMGPDLQVSDQNRPLKRLCRGPTITRAPPATNQQVHLEIHNVDDEIEEFSSQEEQRRANEPPSAQHHSVCSSSKFPLHGHGVLSTQSTGCLRARERKQVMNSQASTDIGTSSNKLVFSKLTVSPLRRFQLIDSDTDSDDPPVCDDKNVEANILNSSTKGRHSNTEDLWKDFSAEKAFQIKTPALDEVCEEYFRSMKNKSTVPNDNKGCLSNSNVDQSHSQIFDLSNPLPPAHRYFFHEDSRIQNLVRTRLPHFFPLGAQDDRGNKHSSAPAIDYMSQFNHGEGSKKVASKKNAQMGSTKSRKNSKKINSEEVSPGSGSWVNPKSRPEIPKDAGKRRVQAVGRSSQSAGHWYTTPEGKKVYVAKNGQELSGRTAYGQYKKDNGARFRKSKKKTAAKKKK